MSNSKKSILASAVIGAMALTGIAQAAVVTVTPVVSRYWSSQAAFSDAVNNGDPTNQSAIPANNSAAGVYEVSFAISTSLSQADTTAGFTGLGNLFFSATSGGSSTLPAHLSPEANFGKGLTDLAVKYNNTFNKFGYTDPFTGSQVTSGTGGVPGNSFFAIADQGTKGDYQGYKVDLGTGVFAAGDPRLTVTQSTQNASLTAVGGTNGNLNLGNPLKVMSIYVVYDGSAATALTPSADPTTDGFGLHNNTTGLTTFFGTTTPGETFVVNPLQFGAAGTTPEPASLSLLALGGLMAARRRRA